MPASELRDRLVFSVRADISGDSPPSDEYGNVLADWEEQFEVYAGIKPLKGGEDVIASRLSGVQPVVIRVRFSTNSERIRPDWRAIDIRTGIEYNIRSIADMDGKRRFFDILATAGEPT